MTRLPWVRDLLAIGWPIALYWAGVALSLLAFTVALFVKNDVPEPRDLLLLGTVCVCALGGAAGGQLVSVSRLRSGCVLPLLLVGWITGVMVFASYEATFKAALGRNLSDMLLMFVLLAPIFASGGFWSLRVNRGLVAAWPSSVLFMASILLISEEQGLHAEWHQGAKYAIWSVSTAGILAVAVLLQIAFMAARERHRLHRWRTAPLAPELVAARPDPLRPFAGLGTLGMLFVLVLLLTLSSAMIAPYLWRTGGGDEATSEPIEDTGEPDPDLPPTFTPPKILRYVQQGAGVACSLATLVVLALAALFVFGPPTRRQLLIAHLRDPMWPVPPSRRARLHWRLAEIALGDAGVIRKPGETARDVAARGVAQLPELHLDLLVSAAEIADRVAYGYALEASDADTLGRAAEMTYQAVWEALSELDRVKATYRML